MTNNLQTTGNSKSALIPKIYREKYNFDKGFEFEERAEGLLLKPSKIKARQGWEIAAKDIASKEIILLPDIFEDEAFGDWEW